MGTLVNNSDAQRNLQALLELCKENDLGEQSCDSDWNPNRGSCNEVPGRREFAGDDGADGNDDNSDLDYLVNYKKFI